MAFALARLAQALRGRVQLLSRPSRLLAPASCGGQTQVAGLTSTTLGKRERPLPFPYETEAYTGIKQMWDTTTHRLDDNSKVFIIDGNIGVNKNKFGKQLAEDFDLKFFPDVTDDDLFVMETGFDVRDLNEQLPENLKHVDLKMFYSQADPKKNYGMGRTQIYWYEKRFFRYMKALEHLLNTGQGVVLAGGVWSDQVYASVMRQFGYFTRHGFNFYNRVRENSICELWKPHVVVYLDAPVSYCREQINKRNNPIEKNSPVLTDVYLQAIENNFKDKYLPKMKTSSEIMIYNATDLPEWDLIVEDFEKLDLDEAPDKEPDKFYDWSATHFEDFNMYRMLVGRPDKVKKIFLHSIPWDAPELCIKGDDYETYTSVVLDNPNVYYGKGFVPGKDNTMLKMSAK